MKGTATLIGGPFAGQVVSFLHHFVAMPEYEPVPVSPIDESEPVKPTAIKTHDYHIIETIPRVFVGVHRECAVQGDRSELAAVVAELLRVYSEHHEEKRKPPDRTEFNRGVAVGINLVREARAAIRDRATVN